MIDADKLIADFIRVAELAGVPIKQKDIKFENLPAPHIPPTNLPNGLIAVYVFTWGNQCLKVGKAGRKTQARYTSQHYNPKSSNSNLAKSILKHKSSMDLAQLNDDTVGNWIKQNTDRINLLVPENFGNLRMSLLEAFVQCRLSPRFEGIDKEG